jgi:hypothetical protein
MQQLQPDPLRGRSVVAQLHRRAGVRRGAFTSRKSGLHRAGQDRVAEIKQDAIVEDALADQVTGGSGGLRSRNVGELRPLLERDTAAEDGRRAGQRRRLVAEQERIAADGRAAGASETRIDRGRREISEHLLGTRRLERGRLDPPVCGRDPDLRQDGRVDAVPIGVGATADELHERRPAGGRARGHWCNVQGGDRRKRAQRAGITKLVDPLIAGAEPLEQPARALDLGE